MKRYLILLLLLLPSVLWAQQTPVTAQVLDPNNVPYSFGTGSATLRCPGNAQASFNGSPIIFMTITMPGLDGNGNFSMTLYDLNAIQPTGCKYTFAICYKDGITCFTTGQIGGITGSTQVNLTTAIKAFSVVIPGTVFSAGTVGSLTVTSGLTVSGTGNFSNSVTHSGTETFATINNQCVVDGTTHTTVQSCITALPSTGGRVYVPAGSYTVAMSSSGGINLSKPVRVECEDPKTTVITFTGTTIAVLANYDSNPPTGSYTDWANGVENCQLIGPGTINGGAGNAGTAIQIGDGTHGSIGALFRNNIIAGFSLGTTWANGNSWGTKFDHDTWANNNQEVLFNVSSGTGLADVEFIHPVFNHFQSGIQMQANAVQISGSVGGDFNFIDPYFQSDQLVVSTSRVKLVNPTFENTNGQATTPYVSHTGGNLEMYTPHFLQDFAGATVPTSFLATSAGHLGIVGIGCNNSSATTFPVIALSGSVNVDMPGYRGCSNSSALFSGSTSGYLNSPNPNTGRPQFNGNDTVDVGSIQTLTSKTLSSPIINGTPSGTGIATLALKKGSGAGNYTNATTTYAVADSTNLCYTVTIPTGWKLGINASGMLSTSTAAVFANAALTDNAACSTANAGILAESLVTGTGAGVSEAFALNWVITGDGNAHNIALQFKTSNAADTANLINSSATSLPTMSFTLMPSN